MTVPLVGMLYYYRKPMAFYILNLITLKPGTGRLFSKRKGKCKNLFVETNFGCVKVPYRKLPSLDTDICFFLDSNLIPENKLITRQEFDEKYSTQTYDFLKKFELGIITDVLTPQDYRNKKQISGFIFSVFENYVYIFKLDEKLIDYEKLFTSYMDELDNVAINNID